MAVIFFLLVLSVSHSGDVAMMLTIVGSCGGLALCFFTLGYDSCSAISIAV